MNAGTALYSVMFSGKYFGRVVWMLICSWLLAASCLVSGNAVAAVILGVDDSFPTIDEADLAAASALGVYEVSVSEDNAVAWRQRLHRQMDAMGQQLIAPKELARVLATDRLVVQGSTAHSAHAPHTPAREDAGIGQLLAEVPSLVNAVGIYYLPDIGMLDAAYGARAVWSMVKQNDAALVSQNDIFYTDSNVAGSVGLAYRRIITGQDLLLGVNGFFDYMRGSSLQRYSIGLEARTSHARLHFNWYQGIGSDDSTDGSKVESADTWDAELAVQLPVAPWIGLAAQYYERDLKFNSNVHGQRYSLGITPVPLLKLVAVYVKEEDRGEDIEVAAELIYRIGVGLEEQLSPDRVRVEHARFQLLDRVWRDPRHIVDRRPAGRI